MKRKDAFIPYPIKPIKSSIWIDFIISCEEDSDCKGDNQYCTNNLWEATKDGSSYGYGSSCLTWDEEVCPSTESFAVVNWNFENMSSFNYYK